jgi:hypothetical protein
MCSSAGLVVPFLDSDIQTSSPLWIKLMRTEYAMRHLSLTEESPHLSPFDIQGRWDGKYLNEYFRLWHEGKEDEFMLARYGSRATAAKTFITKLMPAIGEKLGAQSSREGGAAHEPTVLDIEKGLRTSKS